MANRGRRADPRVEPLSSGRASGARVAIRRGGRVAARGSGDGESFRPALSRGIRAVLSRGRPGPGRRARPARDRPSPVKVGVCLGARPARGRFRRAAVIDGMEHIRLLPRRCHGPPAGVRAASSSRKLPDFQRKLMRSSGLEPPRAVKPTRPSTLRVYQFRHERRGREYSPVTRRGGRCLRRRRTAP